MKIKLGLICFCMSTLMLAQQEEEFIGSEDNVDYKAIFDGTNVYVTLRTEFKETMQSMLRQGFAVYFDIKGKKKKKVSVQYPLKTERPEGGSRPERGERNEQNGPDISKMIESLPKMANYTYNDSSQDFNIDLNSLGIEMNYSYEESTEVGPILEYHLKIPAAKIVMENEDLSKLSIGIVSTKQEQQQENREQPVLSTGGRQGGGQGGRSRGGGGRGAGRGAGRGNGGGPPQSNINKQEVKLDFWFKLSPEKE